MAAMQISSLDPTRGGIASRINTGVLEFQTIANEYARRFFLAFFPESCHNQRTVSTVSGDARLLATLAESTPIPRQSLKLSGVRSMLPSGPDSNPIPWFS
jgi:hypothetical protein